MICTIIKQDQFDFVEYNAGRNYMFICVLTRYCDRMIEVGKRRILFKLNAIL